MYAPIHDVIATNNNDHDDFLGQVSLMFFRIVVIYPTASAPPSSLFTHNNSSSLLSLSNRTVYIQSVNSQKYLSCNEKYGHACSFFTTKGDRAIFEKIPVLPDSSNNTFHFQSTKNNFFLSVKNQNDSRCCFKEKLGESSSCVESGNLNSEYTWKVVDDLNESNDCKTNSGIELAIQIFTWVLEYLLCQFLKDIFKDIFKDILCPGES
jgi:hypothetical protein